MNTRYGYSVRLALAALLLLAQVGVAGAARRRAVAPGKRFAIFDNGSASLKVLVVERIGKTGQFWVVHDQKWLTNLGKIDKNQKDAEGDKALLERKLLPAENQQRDKSALEQAIAVVGELGVDKSHIWLYATQAVRGAIGRRMAADKEIGARSGKQFIKEVVKGELGIKHARILEHHEETELGYAGAFPGISPEVLAALEKVRIFDVGARSTQVSSGTPAKSEKQEEIEFGSMGVAEAMQRLTEGLARGVSADAALKDTITALPPYAEKQHGATPIVIGSVAALLRAQFVEEGRSEVLRRQQPLELRQRISGMTDTELGLFLRTRFDGQPLTRRQLLGLGFDPDKPSKYDVEGLYNKLSLTLRVLELAGAKEPADPFIPSGGDTRYAEAHNLLNPSPKAAK